MQSQRTGIFALLESLRPHQWVKNLLVFVPALMAHKILEVDVFSHSLVAFLCFSLCASAVYQINDLVDIEADRLHPRKSKRPLASGRLSKKLVYFAIPLLLIIPFAFVTYLPEKFFLGLAVYFILTTFYSFIAKQIVVLDVVLLAGLYTIRIITGGLACGIYLSNWLLVFSMFIFISLACVKRYTEVVANHSESKNVKEKIPGRGYMLEDAEQIAIFGTCSAYISVLVLGLYISSVEVKSFYAHPELLWLITVAMLYWISRVWMLARRKVLNEDPIVFAIKDTVSYVTACFSLMILFLAS